MLHLPDRPGTEAWPNNWPYCYRQLIPNIGGQYTQLSAYAVICLCQRRFASPADLRTPRLQVTNR
jgi:hypothetical protein